MLRTILTMLKVRESGHSPAEFALMFALITEISISALTLLGVGAAGFLNQIVTAL